MSDKHGLSVITFGDVILGENEEYYVGAVKETLDAYDVRIGQLEVPYTLRNSVVDGLSREPSRLDSLKGHMDILTMAGNHLYDAKEEGIEDSIKKLDELGILHTGGGMDLEEACIPAIFEKDGFRIGVVNYNCVGPEAAFAGPSKAGGNYVRIHTLYDLGNVANPGGPPEHIRTFPEAESFERMKDEIFALKEQTDLVFVYFHKGIVHKPISLADYEKVVSHAAIDAGADVVFSSHSHILHGNEIYRGKTIYHGLGNGIAWVPSLGPWYKFKNARKNDVFDPEDWNKKRIERFGFAPDPEYPTYPFHPESIYNIFADVRIEDGKVVRTGAVPAIVGKDGAPHVVTRENGGEEVMLYLKKITDGAGLNVDYSWDGSLIVFREKQNNKTQ